VPEITVILAQLSLLGREVPSIHFDKARQEGDSLFRPFALPKPYTSTKDIFCLREKRTVNGYRKISLFNHEIRVPKVPLREEVEVHLVPDTSRDALEFRIWWENQMVQSVVYPLREFRGVYFSTFPNIFGLAVTLLISTACRLS